MTPSNVVAVQHGRYHWKYLLDVSAAAALGNLLPCFVICKKLM